MESKLQQQTPQKAQTNKPNLTGIPTQMKLDFEQRSGLSFDDVRVHYNSDKPAQLQALAYTQGTQVYVGPGQERHLPHELGHVVQQKSGIVRPTAYFHGISVNSDPKYEKDADTILHNPPTAFKDYGKSSTDSVVQKKQRPNYIAYNKIIAYVIEKLDPPHNLGDFSQSTLINNEDQITTDSIDKELRTLLILDMEKIVISERIPQTENSSSFFIQQLDIFFDVLRNQGIFEYEDVKRVLASLGINEDYMQFLYHSNNSAVARDQRGFVVIVEDEAIQNGGANGPQVLPRSEISELLEDLYRKIETGKSRGSGACYDHKTNILTYNSNDPQLIDYPDLLSNWGASVDKVPQFIYFQYPLVSVLMHEFGHRKQALEGLDFTLIQRSPLLIVLAEYDNVIRHENLLEGRCRRKYGANEVDNQQKPDPAYACLIQRTEYFLIQKILRFLNENVYKGDSKALGTVKTILENLQEEPPAKKFLKINMWNKFCELYHISSF